MGGQTPRETVELLIEAINTGDAERAVSLYEPEAAYVVEPGQVIIGTDAIRAVLEGLITLRPTLTTQNYETIQSGEIALYCSSWSMSGTSPDGTLVQQNGKSTDVLRRDSAGGWSIAVDNPWGRTLKT